MSVLVVTLMLCVHNGTTAAAMSINVLHALLLPSQFEFSYTLLHIQKPADKSCRPMAPIDSI